MVGVVIIAAVIPYINAPKGYFIWDDINLIVLDYQIKSFKFIGEVFTRDFFGFSDESRKYGYYRPLVTITYMIDYAIWGKSAYGYHISNMIMHIINCLLIFFILRRLTGQKNLIPLVATLLFATNPIHTESVTWIAGRTDPLCSLLFFGSLYAYMVYADRLAAREKMLPPPEYDQYRGARSRLIPLTFSLLLFWAAMLSKEMALSLPFLLIAYNLIFVSEFKWIRFKRFISGFILFFGASGIYFLIRMKISFSHQAKDPFNFVTTILSFTKTITLYTWKMLFPVYLTGYMQNDLVEEVFTKEFLVPFVLLVAAIWIMIHNLKRNKLIAFGIAFTLITFLPLSNFIRISGPKDMGFMSAERFLYIPSLGVSLLVGMGFAYFLRHLVNGAGQKRGSMTVIALILLVTVLCGFTGLTIDRNRDWYNNESFFKASLERAPNAPILYMLLGNVYSITHQWDKAEEMLRLAIEYIAPRDSEEPTWIYSDIAGIYAKQAQLSGNVEFYDKAFEIMRRAEKSKFHNSAVYYNKGEIYRAMGDPHKAAEYYQKSLEIARDNLMALVKLGMVYQQLAQNEPENSAKKMSYFELSNRAFLGAIELVPNDAIILNNIGHNYTKMNDPKKAVRYYLQAVEKKPDFARAHSNLGFELVKLRQDDQKALLHLRKAIMLDNSLVEPRLTIANVLFFRKNQPQEALKYIEEAEKIEPDNIKTLLFLGQYYRDSGNESLAMEYFKKVLRIDSGNQTAKALIGALK